MNKTNTGYEQTIKQLIETHSPKLLLDFGSGPVNSIPYVNVHRESYDIAGYNTDYHSIDEITKHYDMVLLKEVLEHIQPENLPGVMSWLSSHADSVLITTPNVFDTRSFIDFYKVDPSHVRPYCFERIRELLKPHGFNCKIYYAEYTKNPLRWLSAMLVKRVPCYSFIVYAWKGKPVMSGE